MEEVVVLIVGAGPAGLATAACLRQHSIPYLVVERDDCSASLWRNRSYDRVKLHLAKEFCSLPYMSYPVDTPTYIPKEKFVKYLDDYTEYFGIRPKYCTAVESSTYDEDSKRWAISARDMATGAEIKYAARFLVVATGENSVGNIPSISGLKNFAAESIHSSAFKSGSAYAGQSVLLALATLVWRLLMIWQAMEPIPP